MTKDTTSKTERQASPWLRLLPVFYYVLIVAFIFIMVVLFFTYYHSINDEFKKERVVYVNEISSQLSSAVSNRRDELLSQISVHADLLDYVTPASFADVALLMKNARSANVTIVLCDNLGDCYDLQGSRFPIQSYDLLATTLANDDAHYFFEKSTSGIDYWVFTRKIKQKTIDGLEIVALLELYDVAQFQSSLNLELFNDNGAVLLIAQDGTINLRSNSDPLGFGYNALATFANQGMASDTREAIKTDLLSLTNDRRYASFASGDWLIDYKNIANSSEFIMVIVPIAITSAGVTLSLRLTMAAVAGIIGGIAFLLIFFILRATAAAKARNKELYELELQAKTVESKNDFLAKMSHDIRTPLNAIIGMNYLARTQVAESDPVSENLKDIDTSAKYLLDILNDILDMSKIESGKMELHQEDFSMNELLTSIAVIERLTAQEKSIRFTMDIAPDVAGRYHGDKLRLNQVLMNLLSNAFKFTAEGGTITLTARRSALGSLSRLTFSVQDDGIGMSEEFMKTIFTPFSQDGSMISHKYGGSGLGLAISKSFMDLMGGTIAVTSTLGHGSTFTVVVPLTRLGEEEITCEAQDKDADTQVLVGKHVLLAEDNHVNMVIATRILALFKMTVTPAENGKEALRLYLTSPVGHYDVIITDIRMPEMDGYELADAVRRSARPDSTSVPLFAMSANAFDEDVKASLTHGMNAHLKKPIDVEELKRALCQALGGDTR